MQSEDFLSDMADAMSELGTVLYRIGANPDHVRMISALLAEASGLHFNAIDTDDADCS